MENVTQIATIYKYEFNHSLYPSLSTIKFLLMTNWGHEIIIEETNSLQHLSKKFEFNIKSPVGLNFKGLNGRKCEVINYKFEYHFICFLYNNI